MDMMQRGIVTLLRSAVSEQGLPLPEGFSVGQVDSVIQRHHIHTLAYDGAVRCGQDPRSEAMKKLFTAYYKKMMVSDGQMREIDRIYAAFDENGIDYMPLKGCNMKKLYPKPELRIMGDADILIRMEQYARVIPIMESLGFVSKGESDHELKWQSKGLYLELHKRIIPSYNEDFYACIGDGWHLAKLRTGTRYAMTVEDTFAYLFTHFAKHYRDGGIGCRHVVDLWVYLRAHPALDEGYVLQELEKLQLAEFYRNIRRLIAVWFEDMPSDEKTDYMTSFIFDSGSWGKLEDKAASVTVRDSKHMGGSAAGRLVYIFRRIFPSVKTIRYEYPILDKLPLVLPIVWCVRLFKKVFLERGAVKRKLRDISALSPENIQTRQQALNYVGLDYHF